MKKTLALLLTSLLLSTAAHASLVLPSSVTLPDYSISESTVVFQVENDDAVNNLALDFGTLSSEKFKVKSTSCTCSLTPRHKCSVTIGFNNAPRGLIDYPATDELVINGVPVPIDITVKALVPQIDPDFNIVGSLAYGNITSATALTVTIDNDSLQNLPLTFILPSGMTKTGGTCAATLNSRKTCTVQLTLSPVVCAGSVYSEEFKVVTPHFKDSIAVTADFTGASSPSCVP